MSTVEQYLIQKGGFYYRPDSKGYTDSPYEAGRFDEFTAHRIRKRAPELKVVRFSAAIADYEVRGGGLEFREPVKKT